MEENTPDSTNLSVNLPVHSAFVPDLSQYTPPLYTNDAFWRKSLPLFAWNGPTQAELEAHKMAFILEQQAGWACVQPVLTQNNASLPALADSEIGDDSPSPSQEFVQIDERSEPESPKNDLSMLPLIRSARVFSDPVEENKASPLQVGVESPPTLPGLPPLHSPSGLPEFSLRDSASPSPKSASVTPAFAPLPVPILMREMPNSPLPVLPRPNRPTYSSVVQGIPSSQKSIDFSGCFSFANWRGNEKTAKLEEKTTEKSTAAKRRHRKKA